MSQGNYKIGELIEVTYQASNALSGLTDVKMEIYDETGAKDVGNFPDVTMTEIGSTGRYKGSFTPDAEGKWRVMVNSASHIGKMVKDYDVVAHNIDSIGDAVGTVNSEMAKDVTVAKDSTVAKDATVAKDSTVAKDATVAKEATLNAVSTKIDGITYNAPPMIG